MAQSVGLAVLALWLVREQVWAGCVVFWCLALLVGLGGVAVLVELDRPSSQVFLFLGV